MFSLYDATPTEDVRISTYGDSWFNGGNVGIGTASPTDFGSTYTVLDVYNVGIGGYLLVRGSDITTEVGANDANACGIVGTRTNHPLQFDTNDTARMTIETSGDVTVEAGNLVIGTSGKGISFAATADSSGTMTSEILDDYEEGTWTPTMTSGTGTVTVASVAAATYTKIGRIVYVRGRIDYSTDASVSTSVITFGGLPFTIKNDGGYSGARLTINNQNTAHNYDGSMFGTPNTTTISYQSRSTSMSSQTGAWLGLDMTYVT
jgi:hypothetical protein